MTTEKLTEAYHDDQGHLCLLRQLPAGKEPPTELTLFYAGINPTTKGDLLFDEESTRRTREAYEDKGQERLPFDYDHGMMSFIPSAETGKAAGWWTPLWAEDGSFAASDIEWTPAAYKGIQDKEWLYYSPTVDLLPSGLNEGDPMRVVRVILAAITNLPATKRQKPMVASETMPGDTGATKEDRRDTMSTELLKLLGAETEAGAIGIVTQLHAHHTALFTALGVDGIDRVLPAVEKLKATAATATGLAERVQELTAQIDGDRHAALLKELDDAGKLSDAKLKEWAKTLGYEELKAFGDAAPVHPKYKGHEQAEGDTIVVTLTDEDRAEAKRAGLSEKEFAAEKARQLKADREEGVAV
jgi:phage I-like protein